MRFLKKAPLFLLLFLVICVLTVFIWSYLPGDEIDLNKFSIDEDFACVKLTLNEKSFSLLDEVIDFKFGGEFLIEPSRKRFFLKAAGRFFSPITVIVLVDSSREEGDFEYTIIVKSKKLRRFLEIPLYLYTKIPSFKRKYKITQSNHWPVWSKRKNEHDGEAISGHKDLFLFSTSAKKLSGLIDKLNSSRECGPNRLQAFFLKRKEKPFLIYVNDRKKMLNHFLAEAEEKTSYSFFPTITDLDEIFIYFGNTPGVAPRKGQMEFVFEENASFKQAKKDIRFIAQVLNRIFEANFYRFAYNIEIVKNHVIMDFNLNKKQEKEKRE